MKKKLIHAKQELFLICDNLECDFVLEEKDANRSEESYVNEPCPKCGENLYTEQDYKNLVKVRKFIDFINRWFGWLGTYPDDKRNKEIAKVNTHKNITIL